MEIEEIFYYKESLKMYLKSSALPRRSLKSSSSHNHSLYRRFISKRLELKDGMRNRIKAGMNTEMKIRNWKLYMENMSIMEQNERLRQRAFLLHQENQTLHSQLQNNFSSPSPTPVGFGLQHIDHHQLNTSRLD